MSLESESHVGNDDEGPLEPDLLTDDTVEFWVSKQRELVTSTVDYNLGTLTDLVTSGSVNLAPSYQRRFRWDVQRQSRLIESFLMNAPVPAIFLNEDDYGSYSVIDGKQRLTAIVDFFQDKLQLSGLRIFSDVNGLRFSTLPSRLQSILRTRPTLRAIIILRQSDIDIKFEIFRRLNTGGVQLNPQEVRNSVYPGPFNDMILRLSEHPKFHKLLGVKNKQTSPLYRQMRDAEFVLRFLTFRTSWQEFYGGMARRMDEFMEEYQRTDAETLANLESEFLETLTIVDECFGDRAFRRWEPERNRWRGQVLASLYDAEMFACRTLDRQTVAGKRAQIITGLQALFEDPDFRRSVDAATNTPSFFRDRVKLTRKMLDAVAAN